MTGPCQNVFAQVPVNPGAAPAAAGWAEEGGS